jgi:CheY-like chemotaxis protein
MTEQRTTAEGKKKHRKGRFILLVDSEPGNQLYLSTLLKRFGYQAYIATTARQVFELVTSSVPSLIIASLDLKDMDSLKLMQTLKKSPTTAGIPFITMTRQNDADQRKRSFLYGAADCLALPVTPERLFRAVQKEVEQTPRECMRIEMLLPVKITSVPGEAYQTCMLDLSERGVFLGCEEPAAVNSRLSLLINLNGRLIPVESKVLHSIKDRGGPYLQPGMALEFVQISPEDREAIRAFIRQDILRGIEREKA